MKTTELISLLAADGGPPKISLKAALHAGILAGVAITVLAAAVTLGIRTLQTDQEWALVAKISFGLTVLLAGATSLRELARPASPGSTALIRAALPLGGAMTVAALALAMSPPHAREAELFGEHWLSCLVFIPFLAVAPFLILCAVIQRWGAPTRLRLTGAAAGFTAGGIGALGYALHCADDSLAFLGGWYVLAVAISAALGATFGSRLLRW